MSSTSPSDLTPNFYPISQLSMFAHLIGQQLENDVAQFTVLKKAEDRPHILDDETVERVLKLYTEAEDLVWCYQAQLERWHNENPSENQLQELKRLEQQVDKIEQCRNDILSLVQGFKGKTIDAILGKSDFDLATDMLSGKIQPPF